MAKYDLKNAYTKISIQSMGDNPSFLDLQDKNGDGLIDHCEDDTIVKADACKGCVPNPKAITPNWMKKDETEPYLNEKICKFQITINTRFTSTLSKADLEHEPPLSQAEQNEKMKSRFEIYKDDAIYYLLDAYNKEDSPEAREILEKDIQYTKFYLAPHATSKMQLQYSVPFDSLNDLETKITEDEDVEDDAGDTVVKYDTSELPIKLIRIRKTLNLYSRYLKVFRAMEGGNIFFKETGAIFELEDYGDWPGWGKNSITADLMPDLDRWLGNKGYNLPGYVWNSWFSHDRVMDIEFTFNKNMKLKKLRLWTQECGEKPIKFTSSLTTLNKRKAWKDSTACGYLARLQEMESSITSRVAKPWLEFVEENTFPPVYSKTAASEENLTNISPWEEVGSCIADALGNEFKQLGEDILDDVFSIGDAVAKAFHTRLCAESGADMMDDFAALGLIGGPIAEKYSKDRDKNMWGMGMEQTFGTVKDTDPLVGNFCRVLCGTESRTNLMGDPWAQLDNLWQNNLDKVKFCGLLDMMLDAIACLFKGLTLEEALASMLETALKAMDLYNFGELFVGLPPEKQLELDQLVKSKLENGQVFKEGSANAQATDGVVGNYSSIPKPWLDGSLVEEQKKNRTESGLEGTISNQIPQEKPGDNWEPLGEQFKLGEAADQGLDSTVVMEAYIQALLEVFNDNLLGLLDEMNKFPGAPIVAFIIAQMDCPRPPMFNPSILDWIKDIELPVCNNLNDIVFPRLVNPFDWLPSLKDILAYLWWALQRVLVNLLISIVLRIICKICEILGDAICKALEVAGDIMASLPSLIAGRETFANVIKDSICGPDASDEQVDDTITDMFNSLGAGGAGLADRDTVKNFTEDLSSSITQQELFEAMLGDASDSFKKIGEALLNSEYPSLGEAFRNGDGLASFFKNVGNLVPAEYREQMRQALENHADDLGYPVNPSLCADPEKLKEYEEMRCEILEGRATPEQCKQMFDNVREQFLDDLDDIGRVMQEGIANQFNNEAPPLYSDPGCDNGILPFEPDEIISAVGNVLDSSMEQLKIDFSQDMLGNGGFWGADADWGMMNMIMSDTMANPLSAHQRKVFAKKDYVDFYMDLDMDMDDEKAFGKVGPLSQQRGAYPEKIAEWLQEQLKGLNTEFKSNNEWKKDKPYTRKYENLNIDASNALQSVLQLPDFGFNVTYKVDIENEKVKFIEQGRKADPDVVLDFTDNSSGEKGRSVDSWSYGYEVEWFSSDMIENPDTDQQPHNMGSVGEPWDASRIRIVEKFNTAGELDEAAMALMTEEERKDYKEANKKSGESILRNQLFEYLAVDDSLGEDVANINEYPKFLSCFETTSAHTPALVLLAEMLDVGPGTLKNTYDEIMTGMLTKVAKEVSENDDAFNYGAIYDDLTVSETEYVVGKGQAASSAGTLYEEAEIVDDDGDRRKIRNTDAILGVSRMSLNSSEDENRVIYLDPNTYGGSYMNPPLYIKPVPNKGWFGFINVMFPEIGPCKPQMSDLIDFSDIQSKMSQEYPTLPEDKRLKYEVDCIVERPYNRVLERSSIAGITGIILAACRIYASVHFIKAFATFTRFAPDFPTNFSNIFSQYVVENMEAGFKDAQNAFWELFNNFKDSEFWYSFLEQAVQQYERRLEKGDFEEMYGGDPPPHIQRALTKLGSFQEKYDYPWRQDLKDAKASSGVNIFETLEGYRRDENLKAVKKTEEYAKLILGELVTEQLQYMGKKFIKNLEVVDIKPTYNNLDFYVLSNMTRGGVELDLDKEIKEEVLGLPTEGNEHYTGGGELSDLNGEVYVGYYHVIQEDGEPLYVKNEFPTPDGVEDKNLLRPFADKVTIPIGDVEGYKYAENYGLGYDPNQPFVIEKYMRIRGGRWHPEQALNKIKDENDDLTKKVSEVYPGTLEKVLNPDGQVVGLKGILGLRHGLEFSIILKNGTKKVITEVEVDVLDRQLNQVSGVEKDSKLLWCLLRNLTDDPKFRLITRYIFPMNKVTSLVAIYNDMGFLPSIGQVTVEDGNTYGTWPNKPTLSTKPGVAAKVEQDGSDLTVQLSSITGWASKDDRSGSLWVKEWDNWDGVLLRNSKTRLKKMFKGMYNDRDFGPGKMEKGASPATMWLKGMKESLFGKTGAGKLPKKKARMLRGNPYNADGELCKKAD